MTIYGSHANGGGIASAITPSKINNGAATIGADAKMESEIMKSHVPLVLIITFIDRKSTRLNSSHGSISYAVFCLKKKHTHRATPLTPGPVPGQASYPFHLDR